MLLICYYYCGFSTTGLIFCSHSRSDWDLRKWTFSIMCSMSATVQMRPCHLTNNIDILKGQHNYLLFSKMTIRLVSQTGTNHVVFFHCLLIFPSLLLCPHFIRCLICCCQSPPLFTGWHKATPAIVYFRQTVTALSSKSTLAFFGFILLIIL